MIQIVSMNRLQDFQRFQAIQFFMKPQQEKENPKEKFTTQVKSRKLKSAFRNEDYFSLNKSRARHEDVFNYLKFHELI